MLLYFGHLAVQALLVLRDVRNLGEMAINAVKVTFWNAETSLFYMELWKSGMKARVSRAKCEGGRVGPCSQMVEFLTMSAYAFVGALLFGFGWRVWKIGRIQC